MLRTVGVIAVLLPSLASVARADNGTPPGMTKPVMPDDALTAPGFVTLDRGDATSKLGIEASYLAFGDAPGETALRFDVHAQYVHLSSGFGGYVQLPLGYVDGAYAQYSALTGIGDLDVGGLYVTRLKTPGFAVVLRAGITLPIGVREEGQALVTSLARLTDVYLTVDDATTLRFSASALWHSGVYFARADLGVDANLSGYGDNLDTFVRANVGVGVDSGRLSVSVESTNLNDHNYGWISTAALAARVRVWRIDVYGALVLPVNIDKIGDITNETGVDGSNFKAALTLGVEGRLSH
jgi:hypothetical protein